MALAVFHSAKDGYADFLWRWGLFRKRSELLNSHHLLVEATNKLRASRARAFSRHPCPDTDLCEPPLVPPALQVVPSFDMGRAATKKQEQTGFPVRQVAHALCDFCHRPVHGASLLLGALLKARTR